MVLVSRQAVDECAAELERLRAENERYRKALERLGSLKALTMAHTMRRNYDTEITARVDFANKALEEQ